MILLPDSGSRFLIRIHRPHGIQIRTLRGAYVVILMSVRKRVYQVAIKNMSIFESAMCTNKRDKKAPMTFLCDLLENTKKNTGGFGKDKNHLQEYFLCIRSLIFVRKTILYARNSPGSTLCQKTETFPQLN
jgi:hypothetical protein